MKNQKEEKSDNQNNEQRFLGEASFEKEGSFVGSNPTPRIKNKALYKRILAKKSFIPNKFR